VSARHTPVSSRLHLGAVRLREAADVRDWAMIAREDRELRALASKLAARANWQAAEYQALQGLRAEVHAVLEMIAQEKLRLSEEMAKFNRYRTAWVAYGLYGEAQGQPS
jgi:hypothetical protein